MKTKNLIIFAIILVLVVAIIFTKGFGLFDSNITGNSINTGSIKIPLSDISENAKWYEYNVDGVGVRFFVVRAKDGSIKTAFDACDVCYKSRKGYSQEGDFIVCNNCGNRYLISNLGKENIRGGCWPGYLPNKIDGDSAIIKISDIKKGVWRFK